jgi:hypothetical protein
MDKDLIYWHTFAIAARAADAGADPNVLPATLSTDAPVQMPAVDESGNRSMILETLDHSPESVDLSRFPLPLVEDHAGNRTALAVAENPRLENGMLRADIRFGSQARAQEVLRDARSGIVRSLSVAYRRGAVTPTGPAQVRVTRWTPMHVSPVGAPADTGAGFFRSISNPQENPMDPIAVKAAADAAAAESARQATAIKAASDAARAAAAEIGATAESLGLRAADYLALPVDDARSAMIKAVADARKKVTPEPKVAPVTSLSVDEVDKQRDAMVESYSGRLGQKSKDLQGNPYAGRSLTAMARRFARSAGIRGAEDWERSQTAEYILGIGQRDGGNIVVASFPNFVLGAIVTKIVMRGFEQKQDSLIYPLITEKQMVPDFKQFTIGALGTGVLQKTAENVPFPELSKSEAAYNSTAKMWGGTLSLSLQALVGDDTAEFDRSLRQSGLIANKTIERRTMQKLLMGTSNSDATSTWTSNTTSGCTPVFTTADTLAAARANIGKAPAALMGKIGLDGNPLNNTTRYLIAGPTSGQFLMGLKQSVGGQAVGNGFGGMPELLVSAWLEASTLTGFSTTTYYALAGPEVTGLTLSMISGYESPQVQSYDMGASAAVGWKVWLPFEVDLFNGSNSAGTTIIPGAQQATT